MVDYPGFGFQVVKEDAAGRGRLGRITTPHGAIDTPAFIFCATKASIKALTPDQAAAAGTQVILANTYHLMLQPGAELVARMGGLHEFMRWPGPMLTDSGGFQVFSMGHGGIAEEIKGHRPAGRPPTLIEITEAGAAFRAYTDGARHLLTPELSIDAQRRLGADLVVAFDECTAYHDDRDYTGRSLQRTQRWADRSLARFERDHDGRQALYGVIQGGVYRELRREGAEFLGSRPFFGNAVGGCLGAERGQMLEIVSWSTEGLERARPVHLLGIGGVRDIWGAVAVGIDSFDCVNPTRHARHGRALAREAVAAGGEHLNLRNARFRDDLAPLEPDCPCDTCANFSRAYIQHLLKAGEMLALQLLTLHNVAFMNRLMADIRQAIAADRFSEARRAWLGE